MSKKYVFIVSLGLVLAGVGLFIPNFIKISMDKEVDSTDTQQQAFERSSGWFIITLFVLCLETNVLWKSFRQVQSFSVDSLNKCIGACSMAFLSQIALVAMGASKLSSVVLILQLVWCSIGFVLQFFIGSQFGICCLARQRFNSAPTEANEPFMDSPASLL